MTVPVSLCVLLGLEGIPVSASSGAATPKAPASTPSAPTLRPSGPVPGASTAGGTIGFQTGLEYVSGKPKPLYFAWPLPLTVSKRGHRFSLWGLVRPAGGRTTLTVLVQLRGAKSYRRLANVTTNASGYWALSSSARGVRWRVRWVSPTGSVYVGPPVGSH